MLGEFDFGVFGYDYTLSEYEENLLDAMSGIGGVRCATDSAVLRCTKPEYLPEVKRMLYEKTPAARRARQNRADNELAEMAKQHQATGLMRVKWSYCNATKLAKYYGMRCIELQRVLLSDEIDADEILPSWKFFRVRGLQFMDTLVRTTAAVNDPFSQMLNEQYENTDLKAQLAAEDIRLEQRYEAELEESRQMRYEKTVEHIETTTETTRAEQTTTKKAGATQSTTTQTRTTESTRRTSTTERTESTRSTERATETHSSNTQHTTGGLHYSATTQHVVNDTTVVIDCHIVNSTTVTITNNDTRVVYSDGKSSHSSYYSERRTTEAPPEVTQQVTESMKSVGKIMKGLGKFFKDLFGR